MEKIEKLIFYTLIFSIPFQTRVVLRSWGLKPDGLAHIGIGFNEWNAAFLYFTDLLILAVLGFWFLKLILKKSHFVFSNYDWLLLGFIIISAISIKNASNQTLGFYQLVKLTEFSLLYFYVKSNLDTVFNFTTSFFVFLTSGVFQSVVSILQYFKQSDLGLRFLGETVLNPDLFNVAVFSANGEKILRSYGTTPHPNVLALILFIAIFIFYFLYISRSRLADSKVSLIFYAVLLFGFFFTFSRTIIFGWLVVSLLLFLRNRGRAKIKKLAVATIFISVIFSLIFWPQVLTRLQISPQEEAVSLRGFYNKVSLFEKPFWGVGMGNFVNWFKEINSGLAANLYQPVHNIYLFIFSETGILGLAAFLLFLFFLAKNYLSLKSNRPFHFSLFIIFVSLLFFGLFDHFLLTIQQGRIVFWLVLGLLASQVPIAQQDRAQASGA